MPSCAVACRQACSRAKIVGPFTAGLTATAPPEIDDTGPGSVERGSAEPGSAEPGSLPTRALEAVSPAAARGEFR
jgi:hypothetical protein